MTDTLQGTDAWRTARLGCATASRIADIIAKTKSGPSASRANYLAELVAERLTGVPAEHYSNAAMQWGTDTEPQARAAYAFIHGVDVTEVGFVPHPRIARAGASPDGYIGEDGLIEIKCPGTAAHISTLRGACIPGKYEVQMLWQMATTQRSWCDYVSFDPRLPANMQMHVERVARDEAHIKDLEAQVRAFLAEVEAVVKDLIARYGNAAVAA